jgi:hypothetical protein
LQGTKDDINQGLDGKWVTSETNSNGVEDMDTYERMWDYDGSEVEYVP